MAQVRQHVNARLTPRQRRAMVDVLVVEGWSVAATAERFQVDPKTARKWRDRYLAEGADGLVDRSSRPHTSPTRTPEATRRRVIELRTQRRRGAAWIAQEVDLAPSTVQTILTEAGLRRLDRGDRASAEAPARYVRERPGELIHVDIKKLSAIPPGGGWRTHGRGNAPTPGAKAGYRWLHSAIEPPRVSRRLRCAPGCRGSQPGGYGPVPRSTLTPPNSWLCACCQTCRVECGAGRSAPVLKGA